MVTLSRLGATRTASFLEANQGKVVVAEVRFAGVSKKVNSRSGSTPARAAHSLQCRLHLFGGAQAERRNGQCGIGCRRGRKDSRAENEQVRVIMAAQVAVNDRALRIRSHPCGADDVPRTFGDVPMLDC